MADVVPVGGELEVPIGGEIEAVPLGAEIELPTEPAVEDSPAEDYGPEPDLLAEPQIVNPEPVDTEGAKNARLKAVLDLAVGEDATKTAKAVAISRATGAKLQYVQENIDDFIASAERSENDPVKWRKENPLLEYIVNEDPSLAPIVTKEKTIPEMARVLKSTEEQGGPIRGFGFGNRYKDVKVGERTEKTAYQPAGDASPWQELPRGLDQAKISYKWTKQLGLDFRLMLAKESGDQTEVAKLQRMVDDNAYETLAMEQELGLPVDYGATSALGKTGVYMAQAAGGAVGSMPAMAATVGVSLVATPLAGAIVGGTLMATDSAMQIMGSTYQELRGAKLDDGKTPIDPKLAMGLSAINALLGTGIELATFGQTAKLLGLGKVIAKGEARAAYQSIMRDASKRAVLREFATDLAKESRNEGGEEFAQTLLTAATKWSGKSITAGEAQKFELEKEVSAALEAAGLGAMGGFLLGGAMGSARLVGDIRRVNATQSNNQRLASIANVASSPTAFAAPGPVADMIKSVTERTGKPVTNFYINPQSIVKLAEEHDAQVDDVARDLLGDSGPERVRAAIAEAQDTPGKRNTLEVPVKEYIERIGSKAAAKVLAQDMVAAKGDLTLNEYKSFPQEVAKLQKLLDSSEYSEEYEPGPAERQFVDKAERHLLATGTYTREEVRAQIAPMRAFVRVMAEYSGQDVDAYFRDVSMPIRTTDDLLMGPAAASRWLTQHIKTAMSPKSDKGRLERARVMWTDPNTGGLNQRGFASMPADPATPMVAHYAIAGTKWKNNESHDAGNDLYRLAAMALASITGGRSAKWAGDFVSPVASDEETQANAVRLQEAIRDEMRRLNPEIADKLDGIGVTAVTVPRGDDVHAAVKTAGDMNIAKRKEREIKGEIHDRDLTPKGIPVDDPKMLKLPTGAPVMQDLHPALIEHASKLTDEDVFNDAFINPMTGMLTREAFFRLPKKKHVVSLDLAGIKAINEEWGHDYGDAVIRGFAKAANLVGAGAVDMAHLSGDEFALQTDDEELAQYFIDILAEAAQATTKGITPDGPRAFVFGYGRGADYGSADKLVKAHKDREKLVPGAEAVERDARAALRAARGSLDRWSPDRAQGGEALARGAGSQGVTGNGKRALGRVQKARARTAIADRRRIIELRSQALRSGDPKEVAARLLDLDSAESKAAADIVAAKYIRDTADPKTFTNYDKAFGEVMAASFPGGEGGPSVIEDARLGSARKGLGPMPGPFESGTFDTINQLLDLKGDQRVKGTRDAFARLMARGNGTMVERAEFAIKHLREVEGLDGLHLPDEMIQQQVEQRAAKGEGDEEAAFYDEQLLTEEEGYDTSFNFGHNALYQPAYHGTGARDIDKFSLAKVGTGVGRQSRGYGLYFGDRKEIGDFYRKVTSKDGGGQVYKVEIPENDQLLDYDTELGKQPAKVLEIIKKDPVLSAIAKEGMTGGEIYDSLSNEMGGDEAASAVFHAAGIPGSRHSIASDANAFVIWDENAIEQLQTLYQATPRFYSAVKEAVLSTKQEKNTPQAWLAAIKKTPGVRAEEIEWLGLEEWIGEQKGSITREQVAEFVKAHEIKIEEKERASGIGPSTIAAIEAVYADASGSWSGMPWTESLRYRGPDGDWETFEFDENTDFAIFNKVRGDLEKHIEKIRDAIEFKREDLGLEEDEARRSQLQAEIESSNDELSILESDLAGSIPVAILDEAELSRERNGEVAKKAEDAAERAMGHLRRGEYELARDEANESERHESRQRGESPVWGPLSYAIENALEQSRKSYEEYTLGGHAPGSYREILFYAPGTPSKGFDAPHFDDLGQGLIAHARISEHATKDGDKVLFVEEVQSDLHQEAREKGGYEKRKAPRGDTTTMVWDFGNLRPPPDGSKAAGLADILRSGKARIDDGDTTIPISADADVDGFGDLLAGAQRLKTIENDRGYDRVIRLIDGTIFIKDGARWGVSASERRDESKRVKELPPKAPFKTTWDEFIAKRMIRMAAEQGQSIIGWTTGEQQAERYDLSKKVGQIWYQPHDNLLRVMGVDSQLLLQRTATPQELTGIIGKEATTKLLSTPARSQVDNGIAGHSLEGDDIKIGGEGMKTAYDQRLVGIFKNLTKKHGGKVEQKELENGKTVWTVNIPESLAETVLTKGQTLFQPKREPLRTETPEFKNWFGESQVVDDKGQPKRVYHGAARPDRIGTRFRKSRATSGPMAFFTDDPAIASNYSEGKKDTSLDHPDDYAGWYKYKVGRSKVDIDRAWYFMSPEQRTELAAKLPKVSRVVTKDADGYEHDTDEFELGDDYAVAGKDHWEWTTKEHRGNVLGAAVDIWLNGGTLFDQEEMFGKVLKAAGLKDFEYDPPHASYSAVIPVYLSIKNPLVSTEIPDSVVEALDKASRRQRIPDPNSGVDQWDKRARNPHAWMDYLRENIRKEESYAFTVVPDWVTKTLQKLGYDGIRDAGGKGGGEKHSVWIPFEETQVKSASGNRGTFDPNDPNILRQPDDSSGNHRGFVTIAKKGVQRAFQIFLTEKADLSTFLHESAHVYWAMIEDLANHPDATTRLKNDYATFAKWMGIEPGEEPSEAQQERFARGFEVFVREGKAPSVELAGPFQMFRLWLTAIYKDIEPLNVDLNDEVRGAFGRMLATDQQVKRAQAAAGVAEPVWKSPEAAGIDDPKEWGPYLEARAEMLTRSNMAAHRAVAEAQLRAIKSYRTSEFRKLREVAEDEWDKRPDVRALRYFKMGETTKKDGTLFKDKEVGKLDRGAVEHVLRDEPETLKDVVKALGRRIVKQGEHPEMSAEFFGFKNGKELLRAISRIPDKDATIQAQAEAEIKAKHPEIDGDIANLDALVQKSIHNDENGDWLIREMGMVSGHGQATLADAAARDTARKLVDAKPIGRLYPAQTLNNERSASTKATKAAALGNHKQALEYILKRALEHHTWRELNQAVEDRDRFEDLVRLMSDRKRRSAMAKAGQQFIDASDQILEKLGLMEPNDMERMSVDSALQQIDDSDDGGSFDIEAVRKIMKEPPAGGWRAMTVDQMRVVRRVLSRLYTVARERNTVVINGKRMELDEFLFDVDQEASVRPDKGKQKKSTKLGRALREAGASMNEGSEILKRLSPKLHKALWTEGYIPAERRGYELAKHVGKKFMDAWSGMPKDMRESRFDLVADKSLRFPDYIDSEIKMDRQTMYMIALNMGNGSNRERTLGGYEWGEDDVLGWLDRNMSKEEWDFVQSIWDIMDKELYPHVVETYGAANGLPPEKILPSKIVTKHGIYAGGYIPAKYDPINSRVGTNQVFDALARQYKNPGSISVGKSFTKPRAKKFEDVVSLDWNVVPSHIASVIHYVAFDQFVRNAKAVLTHPSLATTVRHRLNNENYDALIHPDHGWLARVARPKGDPSSGFETIMKTLKGLAMIKVLAFNAPIALTDLLNPISSALLKGVSARRISASMAQSYSLVGFPSMRKHAMAKSYELRKVADKETERAMDEMREVGHDGKLRKAARGVKTVNEAGFAFFEWVGKLSSTALWDATYHQALGDGASEADAIAAAELMLQESIPSRNEPGRKSALLTDNTVAQIFVFISFFNKLYQQVRAKADPAILAWQNADGIKEKAEAAPSVAYAGGMILAALAVQQLVGELLMGHGPEPEEEVGEWVTRKMVAAPFSVVPGAGDLASAAADAGTSMLFHGENKHRQFSPRSAFYMAPMQSVWRSVERMFKEDRRDEQRVFDMLEIIGLGLAPTANAPVRAARYIENAIEGEAELTDVPGVISGVLYGERPNQPANPFNMFSDK